MRNYNICEGRLYVLSQLIRDGLAVTRTQGPPTWTRGPNSIRDQLDEITHSLRAVLRAQTGIGVSTRQRLQETAPTAIAHIMALRDLADDEPALQALVAAAAARNPDLLPMYHALNTPKAILAEQDATQDTIRAVGKAITTAIAQLIDLTTALGFNLEAYLIWHLDRIEQMHAEKAG